MKLTKKEAGYYTLDNDKLFIAIYKNKSSRNSIVGSTHASSWSLIIREFATNNILLKADGFGSKKSATQVLTNSINDYL